MEEFRLDRHFKLWEDNNTQIKRVIFLCLALAVALLVKVLTPFVAHSEDKGPTLERIEQLEKKAALENDKLKTIQNTESALRKVNSLIDRQPWQDKKDDLIARYRDMRSGHTREDYQDEADKTIREIAGMLRRDVVGPLQIGARGDATGGDGTATDLEEAQTRLDVEITSLSGFIDGWELQYLGTRWYDTIRRKEATMSDLSRDLNERLDQFSRFVSEELAAAKQARQAAETELATLGGEIRSEAARLTEIEEELNSILPQWLRGLVEAHQVIQMLPLLLLGAAGYVLWIGINLTRHYRQYALGKQLGREITAEPSMSSTWTLIPRGRLGTAQTWLAYTLFFLVTWGLLEWSLDLLTSWLAIDDSQAWVPAAQVWEIFRWFSRAVFIGALWCVWRMPLRGETN